MEIKVDFPPPVSGPTFKSLRTGEAFIHQDTFASSGKVFMKVVPIVGQGPEDGYQQLCLNTGECFGPPPETNKTLNEERIDKQVLQLVADKENTLLKKDESVPPETNKNH